VSQNPNCISLLKPELEKAIFKKQSLFANGAAVYETSPDWKGGTEKYKLVL